MKKLIVLAIAIIVTFGAFANSADDSVKVLIQKAKIEQEAGRHKLALEYLQMAIAVNPNMIDAQRALGIAALEVRQFDLARQSFLTVLASQPNDAISLEKVTGFSTISASGTMPSNMARNYWPSTSARGLIL